MADHSLLSRVKPTNCLFVPLMVVLVASLFLGTAAHRIVFYALCPALLVGLWHYKVLAFPLLKTPLIACLALYFGYYGLSAVWSPEVSAYSVFRLLVDILCMSIFLCALATWLQVARYREAGLRALVVGIFLVAAGYAVLFYGVEGHAIAVRFEGYGRYVNPIHLSALLAMMFMIWVLLLRRPIRPSIVMASMVVLGGLLMLILLTHTRSTLFGLVAGIVGIGFLSGGRVAATLFFVVLICLGGAYFLWDQSFSLLLARGDTHRLSIWSEALDYIASAPIFGHGILFNPQFLSSYRPEGFEAAHNIILGHLVHGGGIGLCIFLLVAARCMYVSVRSYLLTRNVPELGMQHQLARISIVFICFSSVFSQFVFSHYIVGLHCQWLVFWIPVGLCLYLEGARIKK